MSDMDIVSREDHDAVKDMAVRALDKIEELEARLAKLEKPKSKATYASGRLRFLPCSFVFC